MSHLPELLVRAQSAQSNHSALPAPPQLSAVVISCVDARTDPAHFLGLDPGEVLVIRSLGGRVTDETEQQIAVLAAFSKQAGIGGPEVFVVHHTQCGMERLAAPEARAMVGRVTGLPVETLETLAIHDHEATLRTDVARLAEAAPVPPGLRIHGLRYDAATGALEPVLEAVSR